MPTQTDSAIKFISSQLKAKKLDPRSDSDTVIELYTEDESISQEIRDQLKAYVATKKSRGNWQSYWYRLRRSYLNQYKNLDPYREGPGPGPIKYPRPTVRFEGDLKGTEEDDNSPPEPRPRASQAKNPVPPAPAPAAAPSPAPVPAPDTPINPVASPSPTKAFQRMTMSDYSSGLITLQQTSDNGLALAHKAILWEDLKLNWHVQILAWLPSGVHSGNFEAEVKVDTLTLTFPTGQMLRDSEAFEAAYLYYLSADNQVADANFHVMNKTNRDACNDISETDSIMQSVRFCVALHCFLLLLCYFLTLFSPCVLG